uniref:Retrotransposable element Tf2 n=1 Tax=Cajanus cajan TaxID=3821 RepID=A0A151T536_CAJCA|nr:Retrotransposable element Tf2 [Cajanus cajan]
MYDHHLPPKFEPKSENFLQLPQTKLTLKTGAEHITNLQKLFERLRKYKLRLNPAKCTFGVKLGKLLGFVVSEKWIEVDPDKVRAILEMPAPSTEKEVCGFLGRLNYIARFISQLTATCNPIFKLLRKSQPIVWNEDCQKAFEKIKQYLQEPPIVNFYKSSLPRSLSAKDVAYINFYKSSLPRSLSAKDVAYVNFYESSLPRSLSAKGVT